MSKQTIIEPVDRLASQLSQSPAPEKLQDKPMLFPKPASPHAIEQQISHYQTLHEEKASPTTAFRSHSQKARDTLPATGPLGQTLRLLADEFLLTENQQGVFLVDLKRAWQQVTLKQWRLASKTSDLRHQPLLVPLSLSLTEQAIQTIDRQQELLQRLGLLIQTVGPRNAMLREVPTALATTDLERWLMPLLATISDIKTKANESQFDSLLVLVSEHAVLSAIDELKSHDLNDLLREIEALDDSSLYCLLTAQRLAKLLK